MNLFLILLMKLKILIEELNIRWEQRQQTRALMLVLVTELAQDPTKSPVDAL